MSPGRPGTPKYQRYLNQCFLQELHDGIEAISLRNLDEDDADEENQAEAAKKQQQQQQAMPKRRHEEDGKVDCSELGQSSGFFSFLLSDEEAMRRFQPFMTVTLDGEHDDTKNVEELSSSLPTSCSPPFKEKASPSKPFSLSQRFREPLLKSRGNVHYWRYVCALEVHLMHFLDIINSVDRHTTPESEKSVAQLFEEVVRDTQFVNDGESNLLNISLISEGPQRFPALKLQCESSFHRLLLHSVCQYYKLGSESATDASGNRATIVRVKQMLHGLNPDWSVPLPPCSVAVYIAKA